MYVCGITPYETTHLGHAATFVWSDLAVRVLRELGLDVTVSRNITDVDDDLLAEARARGTSWRSLATQQTYRFEDDVTRLGCAKPTFEPLAHNYVDEVIALANALLDAGRAYARHGSVYFRGSDVHAAAGITREEALRLAAERGGDPDDPAKDDPLDMAVWHRSTDDEPAWVSPWGKGRPGWHAECAAMALATLGTGIDVHAGGTDLAFPHHAYEAAQAEAALGVAPFARAWMRVGTVLLEGEKMAKSTRNLVFVHDLLERWPGEAIRLLVLGRRWWADWEYEERAIATAAAHLDRLRVRSSAPGRSETAESEVMAALLDDLDVPRALEIAEDAGGDAARRAIRVLGLDDVPPLTT